MPPNSGDVLRPVQRGKGNLLQIRGIAMTSVQSSPSSSICINSLSSMEEKEILITLSSTFSHPRRVGDTLPSLTWIESPGMDRQSL